MGCVPTLERGNDKIKLPAQTLIPGPSPGAIQDQQVVWSQADQMLEQHLPLSH